MLKKENVWSVLTECIQELIDNKEVLLDRNIELIDLGMDSSLLVDFVELLNDKMGLELEVDVMYDYTSIGQLEKYILKLVEENDKVKEKQSPDVGLVIEDIIYRLTGVHIEKDDEMESFVNMGIDSSLSVEFIELCNEMLELNLEVDAIYDYATPLEMKEYIQKLLGGSDTIKVQDEELIEDVLKKDANIVDDIAIIGMSGRIGETENLSMFFDLLENGERIKRTIELNGWSNSSYFAGDTSICSFLKDREKFSPLFFHISPKEAERMDPQQRIFMEEAYRAFEDSGYPREQIAGRNIGVFAAGRAMDYKDKALINEGIDAQSFLGNDMSILAGRVSFFFDLNGPSMTIDTACSSVLTAVHEAIRSLQNDECEMALAGGVFIMPSPQFAEMANKTGMLSKDGCCKTFDEEADGMGLAEGAGALVLKPLHKALEDHDNIYGIVKGSGVNHSGRTQGITVPNTSSQKQLISSVYKKYHINPESIRFIELQGTGTKIGDQLEVTALTEAFRMFTDKKAFCAIGSHKPNTGHSIMASGIFGITKCLRMLNEKKMFPTVGIRTINKGFHIEESPFYINQDCRLLEKMESYPLRVAISGFGFGGTNCHMVLEEAPEYRKERVLESHSYLFVLSGESEYVLRQRIKDLLNFVDTEGWKYAISDISYTLYVCREHFPYRISFVTDSLDGLRNQLKLSLEEKELAYSKVDSGKEKMQALFTRVGREVIDELSGEEKLSYEDYKERLMILSDLYLGNHKFNFVKVFKEEVYKVPLPGYPFERKECWVTETHPGMYVGQKEGIPNLLDNRNTSDNSLSNTEMLQLSRQDKNYFDEGIVKLSKIVHKIVLIIFRRMGAWSTEDETLSFANLKERLGVVDKYQKLLKSILNIFAREGFIRILNDEITILNKGIHIEQSLESLYRELEELRINYPEIRAYCNLMNICTKRYHEILTGKVEATEVIFPRATTEIMEGIYKDNLMADYSNQLVASVVKNYVEEKVASLKQGEKIRICEIGAGTGATSEPVFKALEPFMDKIYYAYTDISLGFTRVGMRKFKNKYDCIDFRVLDIEKNTEEQGYEPNSFDIILGTNVLHATKSIDRTLEHIYQMQKKNGIVIINELTKVIDIYAMGLGMLDGWWLYEDVENRLENSPLLSTSSWRKLLFKHQYHNVSVLGTQEESKEVFSQSVMTATKLDGTDYTFTREWNQSRCPKENSYAECNGKNIKVTCDGYVESIYTEDLVSKIIKAIVGEILGIEPSDLDENKSFSDYGIDSIVGLELVEKIDEVLGTQLTTTILYDYASLNKLCAYISNNFTINEKVSYQAEKENFIEEKEYLRQDSIEDSEQTAFLDREIMTCLESEHLKLKEWVHKVLINKFQEIGVLTRCDEILTVEEVSARVGVTEQYERLFGAILHMLERNHYLYVQDGQVITCRKAVAVNCSDVEQERIDLKEELKQIASYYNLLELCLSHLIPIIQGKEAAVEILFDSEGSKLVSNIYKGNALINYTNEWIGEFVYENVKSASKPVRILEIGAGTGATSEEVFVALKGISSDKVSYTYTDISRRFLDEAKVRFQSIAPYAEYRMLNIESDVSLQGYWEEQYDIIIATNVLHATKNMNNTMKNVSTLLKKDGYLVVNEATGRLDVNTLIFGLLEGWWLYEDDFCRIPDTPLLSVESWKQLYEKNLIAMCQIVGEQDGYVTDFYQNVFVGKKQMVKKIGSDKQAEKSVPIENANGSFEDDKKDYVAIIGLSGRFPDAQNAEEFWSNLASGRNSIHEVPADRWDCEKYYDPNPHNMEKSHCKWGGFLRDIDLFDPMFFGISGKEAELTDPQQRIFLTECWKALEDAGYSNEDLNENRCSVYAAALAGDYQECMRNEKIPMDLQSYVGNAASILSSRISYYLNLKGEAITIDTACSSSLVAIALACQSILSGNSDMSLAGGVFLNVGPKFYIQTSNSEMLSSTGVCDAFGNHADGFVPGEGAGVVVLKSLKKALLDGDNIYGVVKGIAINQDGHTNGITAPSAVSQKELELSVYQKADINPETITYIEAHGTGTKLGDPIEVRALTEAFSVYTDKKNYCSLGSVKCNIGHAAMAAGISGIIKILMAMKYKQIPPMINYKTCNEYIDLDNSPFIIDTALREWNSGEVPRRAAISGFGFSGTNVHAVLEEAPEQEIILSEPRTEMFVLSAKNKVALIKYVQKILEYLRRVRSKRVLPDYLFENLIYTLQTGRMQMEERLVVLADNLDDIETQLLLYIDQEDSSKIITGNIKKSKLRNSDMQRTEKEILDSWNRKDYRAIANMWVAGAHIQWKQFYQNEKRKKISLPGYPLDEERYWCLSKKGEMCAKVADDETDVPIVLKKLQWLDSVLQNRKHIKSTVLVMTSDEEYVNQLKVISDCRYITVLPSDDYQKISDSLYHIDWKSSAQCRQLMNDLSNSNIVIQNVIYLHTEFQMEEDILAQLQQDNSLSHEEVCQQVNKYIMPLYYLLHVHQEVYGSSNPLRKILFVYRMVNSVASPFQEAVLGFGCSLKYGRGSTDISVIEVDDENSNCKRMAEIIQTELDNASCDFDVRYIGQKRLVRKLKDIVLEKDNNVPIRRNGCYLITGGLGGLGYVIAKHLAEKYKAKIVLVGRSAYDRSKEQKIEQLQRLGANVFYKSADITKKTEVVQVIKEINEQFGTLHGVFHCAGILDEHSIWEKGERRFLEILQPKITGTVVLDEATRKQPLEFFVLYSSLSSIIGDFEQCDYAVANRFMDSYTVIREQLRKSGLRNGITRTVNWPLWENGGMLLTTEQKATYMSSNTFLTDERGIETLEKILQCKESNVAVLLPKVNRAEHHIEESKAKTVNKQEVKSSVKQSKKEINIEGIRDIIRDGIAELLYLKKEKIEDDESFGMFGFDSISFKDFATWLSDKFQITVSPTCFYAHSTIQQLAEYMVSEFPELMLEEETEPVESEEIAVKNEMGQQGVAIVGMAGLMPEADDIYEFWSNLVDEKDCIKEIPKERWDWREYITNDRHDKRKTVSKWGGFVRNVDCFDAAFFQIPESEAKYIDPQHRLYLQTVWSALEDGGYKPSSLSGKKIGVFTGVQLRDYAELFTDAEQGEPTAIIGTANTMLSNRISYLLNLHGPSESVDTACSSSLVAVHRAVQSIMIGESEMAIAGGVCLDLTPDYYIATSRMGIASATGKCKTFDESADGYVRGEGIGAILLKSLDKAVEDGDFIYAVIKSSATNHGGKASSMTAPNQEAQTALFEDAYRKSVFLPDTISYIEVHGTGTELGDPIEVEALKKAFKHLSKEYGKNIDKKGYCGLGTVKTNIGHLEPASGIAGILKVALALKNGMIPGNLNFKNQNPYINLADSPFYIVKGTKEWKPIKNPDGDAIPRRAGVSSFGFGGTNAHIVLEEYQDDRILNVCEKNSIEVIQFSAKTKESLYAFMLKFRQFISWNNNGAKDAKTCLINCLRNILSKIIHVDRTMIQETELLQDYGVDMIGFSSFMEAINSCVKTKLSTMDFPDFMELSLGQITRTLLKKEGAAVNKWLQESLDTKHPELTLQTIAYTLNVCREAYSERVVILCKDLNELKQKLDKVLSKQVDDGIFLASEVNQKSHGWYRPERSDKVNDIVDACLKGTEIDWTLYYQDPCYYKVSLPAYAFEKKRYWMESDSEKNAQLQCKLIRENAVVADHVVCGETILPGVAQINLMCECIGKVYPKEQITIKDVVWEQKVKVIEPEKTITANFDKENLVVSVTGQGSGKTIKYSEAEVIVREKKQKQWIDIQKIQQRMNQSIEGADIYEAYRRIGLIYGEYYRCVTKVWFNESEAIGKLEIPEKYKEDLKTMEIHPGLVDSALQTAVSILIGQNKLAEETIVPFTVGEVSIYGELTAECYAYAKISKDNSYHVVILDNQGNVVMKLLNITVRKIKVSPSYHTVKPVWKEVEMTDYEEDGSIDMSSHHMVIGEDEQLSVYEKECPSVNKVLWTDAMDISSFITAIKRSEKLESITWIAYSKTEAYIDEEFILKAQRKGVVALFYLVKALIQLGYDEEELNWTFITKCTQEVNEKEKINPVFAGMVGFAGSMAKEFINWRVRFIDTNENDDRNNLTKWYKMRPLENGNVYALRDGKYYVEKLGNLSMKMSDVSAYRKNGVYVVIGGAGGLGMIWSKYMIDQYHAQLVWVGRSGMNDKIQKSIDELAHYGRKPVYISADASDVEQLRHVRDFVLKQFGEIHGIVHSALVLEDHTIPNLKEEELEKSLTAKVNISVRMVQVFKKEPLDFIMFFSSLISKTKAAGQSNYAAGCTFVDSYARYLERKLACKIKLVNWGYWSSKGVVADKWYEDRLRVRRFASINPSLAMEVLEEMMSSEKMNIVHFASVEGLPQDVELV